MTKARTRAEAKRRAAQTKDALVGLVFGSAGVALLVGFLVFASPLVYKL